MYANRQNVHIYKETGAEEHDGNIRFKTGSRNMAIIAHAQWKIRNITII